LGWGGGDNGTDGYQYCLIQQGGRTRNIKENRTRMVMREHIAENEFIMAAPKKNGQERWERRYHRLPPEYSGIGMEEQQNHYDGRSIFALAGITFGVEIGPDHCEGRLRRSPQPMGHRKVQIQLIPSCGTEIRPASVTAVKGGWVFQCDGLDESYTDLRMIIDEHQRLPEQPAKIALYPQRPPAVIHTSCNTEGLFVGGPGKLHFYEPVTIPEAVTSDQKDSSSLREKIAA
ncbi:MAG: hypothetical protein D3922_02960, partial [Candidatus Electrothrix sp. AR1]|nr:hypothetical protein [Candidatus Electrothrix sp. AR1]